MSLLSVPQPIIEPSEFTPDFPDGFIIQEYVNGKASKLPEYNFKLFGNSLPKQPFQYGGEQRLVKDYYPGNSEPVTHILGPSETTVTIKGRLYAKRMTFSFHRAAIYEKAKQLDAMRIRGNMMRISMGEWQRYAFIESTDFEMKNLGDIDYTIKFSIIGFNKPKNYQKIYDKADIPIKINQNLIKLSNDWSEDNTVPNIPNSIPLDIADLIDDATNLAAGVISSLTDFMEAIVSTVEDVSNAINKATGLIRYAQISMINYKDRLGRISINDDLGPAISGTADEKTTKTYTAASFIAEAQGGANDILSILEQMSAQFAAYAATTPLARYRTVQGDTLQKIAVKYYNDASLWELIYEHNELDTTSLEVGLFLEIPQE